jgi:hypothetical protein
MNKEHRMMNVEVDAIHYSSFDVPCSIFEGIASRRVTSRVAIKNPPTLSEDLKQLCSKLHFPAAAAASVCSPVLDCLSKHSSSNHCSSNCFFCNCSFNCASFYCFFYCASFYCFSDYASFYCFFYGASFYRFFNCASFYSFSDYASFYSPSGCGSSC